MQAHFWRRYWKAYRMTWSVLVSYLCLGLLSRFLGEARTRDFYQASHRRNARRIQETILELKGLFIKVGQTLSIMTNFLPEPLTQGLEALQDAVPPHPYAAIKERFRQEFSKTPEELFAEFEEEPIASASLGQVHVAVLKDGTQVAVKVQYPEIDQIVAVDLKALKRIFNLLHLFFPTYGLKEVYQEIAEMVLQELDYQYEGKNLELIRKNFAGDKRFLFPEVFWDYSSKKVLTLEFMEGIKVTDLGGLKQRQVNPRALATSIIESYCKQIFIDGVYHADPHPGNLMVRAAEAGSFQVILVDFGAIARISERMREGITVFAEGLIKRDTRMLANALRQMGFVAKENEEEAFNKLVEYFYTKLVSLRIENFQKLDLMQFQNIEDLLELKKLNISFRDLMGSFHVPRDWVLLERTLLLALGVTSQLDPHLNPIEIILPYVEQFVLKDRSLADALVQMTKEAGLSYLQLPHEIKKTLQSINQGNLTIRDRETRQQTKRLYILGHQFLYALLGLAALGMGHWWNLAGQAAMARYHYGGASFFGVILLISLLKNRKGGS